jgi:hypothetical protein
MDEIVEQGTKDSPQSLGYDYERHLAERMNDPSSSLPLSIKIWQELVEKYGKFVIGDSFINSHNKDDYVLHPEEFFCADENDPKMQELRQKFLKEEKELQIRFYRENFRNFSAKAITETLARMEGQELKPYFCSRMINSIESEK